MTPVLLRCISLKIWTAQNVELRNAKSGGTAQSLRFENECKLAYHSEACEA